MRKPSVFLFTLIFCALTLTAPASAINYREKAPVSIAQRYSARLMKNSLKADNREKRTANWWSVMFPAVCSVNDTSEKATGNVRLAEKTPELVFDIWLFRVIKSLFE